ncbi:MAG: efflux RND transporter periplasmic adaptor subunit [Planctomycetota bacterium]
MTTPRKPDLAQLRIPEEHRAGRRASRLPAAAALLLLAALLYFTRGSWLPRLPGFAPAEVEVAAVEQVAENAAPPGALTANGYIVAQRQAALAPKVPGRLEELLVGEGSRVEKDEVLARLEHKDLDAQLRRAQAEEQQARHEIARLDAQLEQLDADRDEAARLEEAAAAAHREAEVALADAQRELSRAEQLLKDGVGTRAEYESALARFEGAGARRDEAKARERSAKTRAISIDAQRKAAEASQAVARAAADARGADVQLLDAQLGYLTIRAPFSGVVIEKNAEVGEIVAPISGGAQAKVAVVTVVDMASLMVEADVSEAHIGRVAPGQSTRITLDAVPDRAYPGKVFKIVPTADRQKATVEVKVSFDRPDERIVPEMAARVFFLEGEAKPEGDGRPRLYVPEPALRGDSVWVVRDGVVRRRTVQAGERRQGRVEVLGGLSAGEVVVTRANRELGDGMKVLVAGRNG